MKAPISSVVRVGLDLGKTLVRVHAVDEHGKRIVGKDIRRDALLAWAAELPSGCLIAMEASCGAHHLANELRQIGLDARLIPSSSAVPYRIGGRSAKNDATDAEAICEACSRPLMRFVPVKTPEQLAWLGVHRLREGYVADRTAWMNRARGLVFEFGVDIPRSVERFEDAMENLLLAVTLPTHLKEGLIRARSHFRDIQRQIKWCDQQIDRHVRIDANAAKALTVRGVGPLSASALAASLGDLTQFRNGRQLSAFLGLVPKQNSSGGITRLGSITKRGDPYLRRLLVLGARAALFARTRTRDPVALWATQLKERVGAPKAIVALARRNSRILWRLLAKEGVPLP